MKDPKFGKSHYNHPDYTVTRTGDVYSWKSGQPVKMDGTRTKDGNMAYTVDGFKLAGHYLVMEIWGSNEGWLENTDRKIKHIDNNGCNNDLDNLCYMTTKEFNEFRAWYRNAYNELLDVKREMERDAYNARQNRQETK